MTDNASSLQRRPLIERQMSEGRGIQRLHRFANGYGASVIKGPYNYGGDQGLWEVAVLDWPEVREGWHITYSTPITDDVIGHLSAAEVEEVLDQIESLVRASA